MGPFLDISGFVLDISSTYFGHFWDISGIYLEPIWDISIWNISGTYLGHLWYIYRLFLSLMWKKFGIDLDISRKWLEMAEFGWN